MTNVQENNTIKVLLENGLVKVNLELTGVKGAKGIARQVFEAFLDTLEGEEEPKHVSVVEEIDVMEEMKKAYLETAKTGGVEPYAVKTNTNADVKDASLDKEVNFASEGLHVFRKEGSESNEPLSQVNITISKKVEQEDDWVKPIENQLDKYNKEFPKLQDALSRNLYNKLTELQINQFSYFVTDKGVLKLQARYSCTCGNFKKHWVAYPNTKKAVRCSECSKVNTLVNVKGNFPSTDQYGNVYVTSNMTKVK